MKKWSLNTFDDDDDPIPRPPQCLEFHTRRENELRLARPVRWQKIKFIFDGKNSELKISVQKNYAEFVFV